MKLTKREEVMIKGRIKYLSELIASFDRKEPEYIEEFIAWMSWRNLLTRILNESDKEE